MFLIASSLSAYILPHKLHHAFVKGPIFQMDNNYIEFSMGKLFDENARCKKNVHLSKFSWNQNDFNI